MELLFDRKYMSGIESGQRDFEREERDLTTRYNEFIITSVRTQWGISLERLSNDYGTQLEQYCLQNGTSFFRKNGKLEIHEGACFAPHPRRNFYFRQHHERPALGGKLKL